MACVINQWGYPVLTYGCPTYQYYFDRASQSILTWIPDPTVVACEQKSAEGLGTHEDRDVTNFVLNQLSKISFSLIDLVDLTTATAHIGITGSYNFADSDINLVIVDNLIPDPQIAFWWGPSQYGDYGIFGWAAYQTEMPVLHINWAPCFFIRAVNRVAQGFMICTKGVTQVDAISYGTMPCPQPQFNGVALGVPT